MPTMAEGPIRTVDPASLKWQDDGELSSQDLFNLVCRLRDVEPGERSCELWRLAQKYPKPRHSGATLVNQ